MDNNKLSELYTEICFHKRPISVPGDLRPVWRICAIVLALHLSSRGGKSSFGKLHLLNWALKSKKNQYSLAQIMHGKLSPDSIIVRIEPALNRAVDLASGEDLLTIDDGKKVVLTEKGVKLAESLMANPEIFKDVKGFLATIGKKQLTETEVNKLFSLRI